MFTAPVIPKRTYAAESLLIFAAAATSPSVARKNLIDGCVRSLKTAGVWSKLDFLYLFAAHEETLALVNWKSPGTFNAVKISSPTFATNVGYTGDGVDDVITSNFNPTTAGGNFARNSAHIGGWVSTNVAEDRYVIGPSSTSGAQLIAFINPRTAAGDFNGRINDVTTFSVASGSSIGHWGANRSGASAREFYKDGAALGTDTIASSGLNNTGLVCLKGGAQFSTRQVRAFHAGSSLSSGEWSSFYSALNSYMSGL